MIALRSKPFQLSSTTSSGMTISPVLIAYYQTISIGRNFFDLCYLRHFKCALINDAWSPVYFGTSSLETTRRQFCKVWFHFLKCILVPLADMLLCLDKSIPSIYTFKSEHFWNVAVIKIVRNPPNAVVHIKIDLVATSQSKQISNQIHIKTAKYTHVTVPPE